MAMALISIMIPVSASASVALYLLFLYLYKVNYDKHLKDNAFYSLVPTLAVGDMGMLLFNSVYTTAHYVIPIPSGMHMIVTYLENLWFHLMLFAALAMTVNRYCAICWPSMNDKLFGKSIISGVNMAVWGAALFVVFVYRFVINCEFISEHEFGALYYSCVNVTFNGGDSILPIELTDDQKTFYLECLNWLPSCVAVLIVGLYIRCFYQLYRHSQQGQVQGVSNEQQQKRRARDRRMMYQGALIGLGLCVANVCFVVWFLFPPGVPALMNISNSALTAFIFLIFNRIFRHSAKKLVFGNATTTQVNAIN